MKWARQETGLKGISAGSRTSEIRLQGPVRVLSERMSLTLHSPTTDIEGRGEIQFPPAGAAAAPCLEDETLIDLLASVP